MCVSTRRVRCFRVLLGVALPLRVKGMRMFAPPVVLWSQLPTLLPALYWVEKLLVFYPCLRGSVVSDIDNNKCYRVQFYCLIELVRWGSVIVSPHDSVKDLSNAHIMNCVTKLCKICIVIKSLYSSSVDWHVLALFKSFHALIEQSILGLINCLESMWRHCQDMIDYSVVIGTQSHSIQLRW